MILVILLLISLFGGTIIEGYHAPRSFSPRERSEKRFIRSVLFSSSEPFPTRTLIPETISQWKLSHETPILFVGSCFSSNIYQRMKDLKFPVLSNPQGILFNPSSIASCLTNIIQNRRYTREDLFLDHNPDHRVYHSYDHHSEYDGVEVEEVLQRMNNDLSLAHHHLRHSRALFMTLGTAKVYYLLSNKDRIVANCHKQPGTLFEHRMMTSEEIVCLFQPLIQDLLSFNSQLQIVFTVSPIRHTRDGIISNSLSKSTLLYSIHQLIAQEKRKPQRVTRVTYFPAYEYMMDDLRDYRYYEEDLIHPNHQALSYIFHYFQRKYFSDDTLSLLPDIQKLSQHLQHRPKDRQSKLYQQSLSFALQKIALLEGKCSSLNYQEEKEYLQEEYKKLSR